MTGAVETPRGGDALPFRAGRAKVSGFLAAQRGVPGHAAPGRGHCEPVRSKVHSDHFPGRRDPGRPPAPGHTRH